ncbi:hypothetical protein POVWA1_040670 [Plasmodium ovale wallikeri]|uniref:Uncharacterized protein n=1 Tax=Plasmodium ovale wallikeri TaxID=864142 RepID=A0A1A8Z7A2_PLAOA|nr:hypothetical protein POVWA1_040670 [Plasmodium ovale wallikeri]
MYPRVRSYILCRDAFSVTCLLLRVCCYVFAAMRLLLCVCCYASAAMRLLLCVCCYASAAMRLLLHIRRYVFAATWFFFFFFRNGASARLASFSQTLGGNQLFSLTTCKMDTCKGRGAQKRGYIREKLHGWAAVQK